MLVAHHSKCCCRTTAVILSIQDIALKLQKSLYVEERESVEWLGGTWKTGVLNFFRWIERDNFWVSFGHFCIIKKEVINHGNEQNLSNSNPHLAILLENHTTGRSFSWVKSYREQTQTLFHLPLTVRLKHPNLSPDNESAPHCNTTALGWYISITFDIIYNQYKTSSC